MIVRTRVFELCNGRYRNLSDLAESMGISVDQVYRVYEGTCSINRKFIVGTVKAFPAHRLDELFYLVPDSKEGRGVEEKQRMGIEL